MISEVEHISPFVTIRVFAVLELESPFDGFEPPFHESLDYKMEVRMKVIKDRTKDAKFKKRSRAEYNEE
jgi:hypothetical protein